MADYVLNSVTYSGSPTNTANPQRPDSGGVVRTTRHIGREIEALDGSLSEVRRGTKRTWKLTWTKMNATTQAAIKALYALSTTFPLVDQDGASYTVLCTGGEPLEETISTNRANAYLYNVTLVLREA